MQVVSYTWTRHTCGPLPLLAEHACSSSYPEVQPVQHVNERLETIAQLIHGARHFGMGYGNTCGSCMERARAGRPPRRVRKRLARSSS